jgi:hypothetical protein
MRLGHVATAKHSRSGRVAGDVASPQNVAIGVAGPATNNRADRRFCRKRF